MNIIDIEIHQSSTRLLIIKGWKDFTFYEGIYLLE